MKALVVPNRVDAIRLTRAQQVTGPLSDFEVLPWFDGQRDHSSTTPFLASAINAEPFADHSYWLEPGVHLHWTLPDGLTRGATTQAPDYPIQVDELWFPAVPNRWLVLREGGKPAAWLVESDYVHTAPDPATGAHRPVANRPNLRAVAYPNAAQRAGAPPYLFLGRQIPLNSNDLHPSGEDTAARPENLLAHYGPPLTALGHGDPGFATHYPTCRSLFGLHDPTPPAGPVTYHVYGWYAERADDPLPAALATINGDAKRALSVLSRMPEADLGRWVFTHPGTPLFDSDWQMARYQLLRERFGWGGFSRDDFSEETQIFATDTVTYASTVVTAEPAPDAATIAETGPVAIGANPEEAYAAYLLRDEERAEGQDIAGLMIHDLGPTDLSAHALDLPLKAAEARHSEQFRALKGHMVWELRPMAQAQGAADAAAVSDSKTPHGLNLPEDIAADLNALNVLQERYDRRRDHITSLRQDLFADWAQFMRAVYPDGDRDPFAVNPDDLQEVIERTRLAPLEELIAHTGHLYIAEDADGAQQVSDLDVIAGPSVGAPNGTEFAEVAQGDAQITGLTLATGDTLSGVLLEVDGAARATAGVLQGTETITQLRRGERIAAITGHVHVQEGSGSAALSALGVETNFGRRIGPTPAAMPPDAAAKSFRLAPPRGLVIVGLRGTVDDSGITELQLLCADPHLPRHAPLWGRASIAAQITVTHRALSAKLAAIGRSDVVLGATPGPRYYVPNDPVIALGHKTSTPSQRHGHDGDSEADDLSDTERRRSRGYHMVSAHDLPDWATDGIVLAGAARAPLALLQGALRGSVDASPSAGENWHPIQIEWQAELLPLAEGGNADQPRYDPDFITKSHALTADSADLQETNHTLAQTYQYLSGRGLINASVGRLLRKRLAAHEDVWDHLLSANPDAPAILPLGGFHEQLLQRQPEPQLPVEDPVGLPAQRGFAQRVQQALGPLHAASPAPDRPFHPIRSGEITLQRLRIIDSFGRTRDWRPEALRTVARMHPPSGDMDRALLPVRLSQPARLAFRWLSAQDGAVESNAHPASSPICGWVAANELDRSLVLYGASGRMLGSLDIDGRWQSAPGDPMAPRSLRDIAHPAMAGLAAWLGGQADAGADLIDAFLDTLEAALERIDPAEAATHQARAMLVSRPMALVRARLGLEAQHDLAEDQSLRALRARLQGHAPDTHGAGAVRIPLRLGEHGQLNDGLCGYWIDDAHGVAQGRFHTPTGLNAASTHPLIHRLTGGKTQDFPLQLALEDAPKSVTLLMDPLGVIHATTGVLPTKSIALPSEQTRAALSRLRVSFAAAPLLMPADHIAVPLPAEPGFSWSWLERAGDDWHVVPHHPTVQRDAFIAGFGKPGAALWDRLLTLGRLQNSAQSDEAQLVAADPDAPKDRFDDLGLTPEAVERGLHALAQSIEVPLTQARSGSARAVARDGWLQLTPTPQPTQPQRNDTEPDTEPDI